MKIWKILEFMLYLWVAYWIVGLTIGLCVLFYVKLIKGG